MALSQGDFVGVFRKFFSDFAKNVKHNDQLPVQIGLYRVSDSELSGAVVDWTLQYLQTCNCPSVLLPYLTNIVLEEVKILPLDHCLASISNDTTDHAQGIMESQVYRPLPLMQTVIARVNDVCLRHYQHNITNIPIPSNNMMPHPVSHYAVKNCRRKMEDRHVIINDLHTIFGIQSDDPASYYAVFDGHAGQDAAVYSSAHLHQHLIESIHYHTNTELAIKEAFIKTDLFFTQKSNAENLKSGSTAVCSLIKGNMLYVAWLGDSQAVLVRNGQSVYVVDPHKPNREDERYRIESLGGYVIHWGTWRVNGQLAVSRAIGDTDYKPFVCANPDITTVPLNGTEDFLVLACDGLWDTVTFEDAVALVYQYLRENPGDVQGVSPRLVKAAKDSCSSDNITVIVIFLRDPFELSKRPPLSPTPPSISLVPPRLPVPLVAAPPGPTLGAMNGEDLNNPFSSSNGGLLYHNHENAFFNTTTKEDAQEQNKTHVDLLNMSPYDADPQESPEESNVSHLNVFAEPFNPFTITKEPIPHDSVDTICTEEVTQPKSTNGMPDFADSGFISPATRNPFTSNDIPVDHDIERDHVTNTNSEIDRFLNGEKFSGEFDPTTETRDETPTPPIEDLALESDLGDEIPASVPEADSGLIAEEGEDSEDDWSYYRVEPSKTSPSEVDNLIAGQEGNITGNNREDTELCLPDFLPTKADVQPDIIDPFNFNMAQASSVDMETATTPISGSESIGEDNPDFIESKQVDLSDVTIHNAPVDLKESDDHFDDKKQVDLSDVTMQNNPLDLKEDDIMTSSTYGEIPTISDELKDSYFGSETVSSVGDMAESRDYERVVSPIEEPQQHELFKFDDPKSEVSSTVPDVITTDEGLTLPASVQLLDDVVSAAEQEEMKYDEKEMNFYQEEVSTTEQKSHFDMREEITFDEQEVSTTERESHLHMQEEIDFDEPEEREVHSDMQEEIKLEEQEEQEFDAREEQEFDAREEQKFDAREEQKFDSREEQKFNVREEEQKIETREEQKFDEQEEQKFNESGEVKFNPMITSIDKFDEMLPESSVDDEILQGQNVADFMSTPTNKADEKLEDMFLTDKDEDTEGFDFSGNHQPYVPSMPETLETTDDIGLPQSPEPTMFQQDLVMEHQFIPTFEMVAETQPSPIVEQIFEPIQAEDFGVALSPDLGQTEDLGIALSPDLADESPSIEIQSPLGEKSPFRDVHSPKATFAMETKLSADLEGKDGSVDDHTLKTEPSVVLEVNPLFESAIKPNSPFEMESPVLEAKLETKLVKSVVAEPETEEILIPEPKSVEFEKPISPIDPPKEIATPKLTGKTTKATATSAKGKTPTTLKSSPMGASKASPKTPLKSPTKPTPKTIPPSKPPTSTATPKRLATTPTRPTTATTPTKPKASPLASTVTSKTTTAAKPRPATAPAASKVPVEKKATETKRPTAAPPTTTAARKPTTSRPSPLVPTTKAPSAPATKPAVTKAPTRTTTKPTETKAVTNGTTTRPVTATRRPLSAAPGASGDSKQAKETANKELTKTRPTSTVKKTEPTKPKPPTTSSTAKAAPRPTASSNPTTAARSTAPSNTTAAKRPGPTVPPARKTPTTTATRTNITKKPAGTTKAKPTASSQPKKEQQVNGTENKLNSEQEVNGTENKINSEAQEKVEQDVNPSEEINGLNEGQLVDLTLSDAQA